MLYRIEREEVQEYFRTKFKVEIFYAAHRFNKVVGKPGADGIVCLADQRPNQKQEFIEVYEHDPVSLHRSTSFLQVKGQLNNQMFELWFQGQQEGLDSLQSSIRDEIDSFVVIWLYIFNRFRATAYLEQRAEEDRKRDGEIVSQLRAGSSTTALEQIARKCDFDWLIVLLYSSTTESLVPIASSDPTLLDSLLTINQKELAVFQGMLEGGEGLLITSELSSHAGSCNCRLLLQQGAKQAAFLFFGHDGLQSGVPRGVLAFYRKQPLELTHQHKRELQRYASEVAGWIDDLDEKIEHAISRRSIVACEERCRDALTNSFGDELFSEAISDVATSVEEALSAHELTKIREITVQIGIKTKKSTIGYCPPATEQWAPGSERLNAELIQQCYHCGGDASILVKASKPFDLQLHVSAQLSALTLLRPHIFDWLHELLGLVHHMVVVEARRLSWIQRTIHDVRQPLQGLVTMGSEIRRLASLSTVPRKEIEFYAEDMETSIMRIKVLLEIFGEFAGTEVKPTLRNVKLESEILRPIRRLLSPVARKLRLTIGPTIGYERLPALYTDPDLLSIIFYNLLDNALKYSHANSVVRVHCEVGQEYCNVDVCNQGLPILDEEAPKIFQEHYRGSAAKSSQVGLGIGLSMAKRLSKLLNLDVVYIHPKAASGDTIFRVIIPNEQLFL